MSVIILVFNQEEYISHCIRSLLNQKILKSNFEIIIINNWITDDIENVLTPFKNGIIYLKNNKYKVLPKSLNLVLDNSKGQFIIRLDSSDEINSVDTIISCYKYIEVSF